MNAAMLCGGLRSGPIRPAFALGGGAKSSRRDIGPRVAPELTGVGAPISSHGLRVEERGGVWCVVGRDGATLAPCASEPIARNHAAALARLSRP